jgi:hypothetical protein
VPYLTFYKKSIMSKILKKKNYKIYELQKITFRLVAW